MKLRVQKEDIYAGNLRFTQIETCARYIPSCAHSFLSYRLIYWPWILQIEIANIRLMEGSRPTVNKDKPTKTWADVQKDRNTTSQ